MLRRSQEIGDAQERAPPSLYNAGAKLEMRHGAVGFQASDNRPEATFARRRHRPHNLDCDPARAEYLHMAATIEQLIHDALALPTRERAHLAHLLLESLEPFAEKDVLEAWEAEVSLRLESIRLGTARGRPVSEVFRDLAARRLA